MQRVIIVMSHPWPANNAPANRVSSFVEALRARSQVTVVSPPGNGRLPAGVQHHVVRYTRGGKSLNLFGRAIEELKQTILLVRAIRSFGHSATIVLTIPSMFLLVGALFARGPVIVDIRDLAWEYIAREVRFGTALTRILRVFVRMALGKARTVLVTNPGEQRYIARQFGLSSLVIANGVETERLERLQGLPDTPRQTPATLRLLYLGNVGFAQNLPALVRALAPHRDVELDIIGSGNDRAGVQRALQELACSHIRLQADADREQAFRWYEAADVLVAQLGPAFDIAVPSKLYEYLATGKPMLYVGRGSAAQLLAGFDGVVVANDWDAASIAQALASLRPLVGRRFTATRRPRLLAEFTRERAAEAFAGAVLLASEITPSAP